MLEGLERDKLHVDVLYRHVFVRKEMIQVERVSHFLTIGEGMCG